MTENTNEPYSLTAAEIAAISEATGVRADVVGVLNGSSYAEIRANAEKVHDMAPVSRIEPPKPPQKTFPDRDKLTDAIRRRMNGR